MHMFLSFLTTVIQNFSCQVWWQHSHTGSSCSRLKIISCLLSEAPVMTKNIRIIFFFFSKSLPKYNYDVFLDKHPLSYRSLYFSNDKRWSRHFKHNKPRTSTAVFSRRKGGRNLSYMPVHPPRHCHLKCRAINCSPQAERAAHWKVPRVH